MANFKVTLSRKAGDIEQQAGDVVSGDTATAASDRVLAAAKGNPLSFDWTPVLASGLVADDSTIAVLSSEKTDEPVVGGADKATGPGDKPRNRQSGTSSGLVGTADLKGLGSEGVRVRGDTGAIEHLTEAQLQAQRQGTQGDTFKMPPERARSEPALASAPGTGGVKAALNNPLPRPGLDDGRVLDVNSTARDDDGREASIDVAQERSGQKPVPSVSE